MSGTVPSTDAIFEASNPEEFSRLTASVAHSENRARSLKDFVALFFREEWTERESFHFATVGLEHLTTFMFGKFLITHHSHLVILTE
jgi:hypothetical protein